jgi:uncharacterized membrane protein YbhN (UPF0104 family)
MRTKLRQALPWAVTAGVLGYLFWKTPLSEVWAAMTRAAPWTVPAGAAAIAANFLADSFATWKTFGWFLARLPFRDVLVVRGATYLLAAINYSVGQGAIVYFVHRARGVPVMRGVATVLLIVGTNLLVLLALVTVGLLVGGERPPALPLVAGLAWGGLTVYAVVVAVRPRLLATRPLFDVLLSAGVRGHLKTMAARLPHVAVLIVFWLAMLRGFGVEVPFRLALTALPVVLFIAALPISPQGLGTTQAAMILFFTRYVPPDLGDPHAVVLAASLGGQGIALACQVVIGLLCMRSRLARGLGKQTRAAMAESDSP